MLPWGSQPKSPHKGPGRRLSCLAGNLGGLSPPTGGEWRRAGRGERGGEEWEAEGEAEEDRGRGTWGGHQGCPGRKDKGQEGAQMPGEEEGWR